MYMSGAYEKMVANSGLFGRLLEQEPEPLLVETIEKGETQNLGARNILGKSHLQFSLKCILFSIIWGRSDQIR